MNGTIPPGPASPDASQGGPAPLPDNDDKNKPIPPPGVPTPPVGGPPASPSPPPSPPSPPPPKPPPPPPPPVGGSVVPPPPGHEVDIRTMASDAKSLKSSGGLGVEPKTFDPSDLTKDPVFKSQANAVPKAPKSKKRVVLISVAIVVILALAAATVFFFVLPLFSPQEPSVVIDETPLPPPPPPPPALPSSFIHESFFVVAPSDSGTANIESIMLDQINSAFVAGTPLPSGLIREVSFNTDGEPLNAQDFLAIALPGLDNSFFNEDFTSFVYSDGVNMWPGYVFRLADGEVAETAEAATRGALEGDANLDIFYVTSPGIPDEGGFRDGSVGLVETRYLSFGEAGASFNYGWNREDLILSTSFAGFQKAVELLEEGS